MTPQDGSIRGRARPGEAFIAVAIGLSVVALLGQRVWYLVSPKMELTRACYTNDWSGFRQAVTDPWGRAAKPLDWPMPFYSVGPNGLDEATGGDDVIVYPVRHPAVIIHTELRLLALLVLGAIVATRLIWIVPAGRTRPHEAFRAGLIALVPLTLLVLGGRAVLGEDRLKVILTLAVRPESLVRAETALVGSIALLCWLLVFGTRVGRIERLDDVA